MAGNVAQPGVDVKPTPTPTQALFSLVRHGDTNAVKAVAGLNQKDFSINKERLIYNAIKSLQARDVMPDAITIKHELDETGNLSECQHYLADLATTTADPGAIQGYTVCIQEAAAKRRQLVAAQEVVVAIARGNGVEAAAQALHDSMQAAVTNGKSIGSILKKFTKFIDLRQKGLGPQGVKTGIPELDDITNGFQPEHFIVIAARPSVGKTVIGLNIAHYTAMQPTPSGVLIFSLEMPEVELTGRLISAESQVYGGKFGRVGAMTRADWAEVMNAANRLHQAPIFIDDTPALEIDELVARARRMKSEHDIGLIVIDYLQLIRCSSPRGRDRQGEIAEISRSLKTLAKELKIPVIALSQLNRDLEKRADKRPMMSDLRESGAIEQDADIVLFLYREALYCEECKNPLIACTKGHERDAEIIIGKNRGGPLGVVPVEFYGETQQFLPVNNGPAAPVKQNNRCNAIDINSHQGGQNTTPVRPEVAQMAAELGIQVNDNEFNSL